MKKPADVEDLTARLKAASSAPLVAMPPQEEPARRAHAKKAVSKPLFLRVPGHLYARYEAEATRRTKETGKGVTIQQVMLEKLEGDL
jgi:hypothetical protein